MGDRSAQRGKPYAGNVVSKDRSGRADLGAVPARRWREYANKCVRQFKTVKIVELLAANQLSTPAISLSLEVIMT
jgi:hypothetical protein